MAAIDLGLNRTSVEILFTECDLAMTFLDIASTSTNPDTVQRNRKNARRAYDTVLYYLPRLVLTAVEGQAIQEKLSALRVRIEAGEKLPK